MRPSRLSRGLVVGVLAAAATAGALAGFGVRLGTPARPFNVLANALLGDRAAGIWGFDPVVTLTGVALHVAVMCGWGVLFAALVGDARGGRLWGSAALFSLAALGIDVLIASRLLGSGVTEVLAPAQVAALHVVLGAALAVGIRLAHSQLWSEHPRVAARDGDDSATGW